MNRPCEVVTVCPCPPLKADHTVSYERRKRLAREASVPATRSSALSLPISLPHPPTMGDEVLAVVQVDLAARSQAMAPSHTAVRPLTDPSFAVNNSSMSTVPEDSDEAWADAPEPADTDDDASEIQQITESDGRSSRTSTHPLSGLPSATNVDELKEAEVSGKSFQETIMTTSLHEPPPFSSASDETPGNAEESSIMNASTVTSITVPSSRTASVSGHLGSSIDVASSSSHTRPISPAPTSQSASALDRRQTRRRSVLDVSRSLLFFHPCHS